MTYTLNSGIKGTVPLSPDQIKIWMECYKNGVKFVTEIGQEFFGLNPELVADFKVHNKYSSYQETIMPVSQGQHSNLNQQQLSSAYKKSELLIKVDCKCGASYVTHSPLKRTKWYCNECNEIVFLDMKKGLVDTPKGPAHYMTNKYFVERDSVTPAKEQGN
ncbi:hypothetical protein AWM70_10175 [Paenibacillus yonginensis]|uniref:Uncharacterized protein n=1 Tax=Paenibacillus yonginensis TaxID=1462996 RepID=A0A1B1N6Y6_9BACL|nr:hypothetical protein [Paenibacillus yonginensis]ANS77184.1 hypothetical protein AWM70_10175 [Paenibacillus yonginensis]